MTSNPLTTTTYTLKISSSRGVNGSRYNQGLRHPPGDSGALTSGNTFLVSWRGKIHSFKTNSIQLKNAPFMKECQERREDPRGTQKTLGNQLQCLDNSQPLRRAPPPHAQHSSQAWGHRRQWNPSRKRPKTVTLWQQTSRPPSRAIHF